MSIVDYMIDEIAVGVFASDANRHGRPSYAAPVIVKARIEEKIDTVRGADGTNRNVSTVVATVQPIGYRDRVWVAPFSSNNSARVFTVLPSTLIDSDAKSPVVVKNARKMRGDDGHFEVWL